jgi:NAD-dependent SIR2 family protein deacetylase
MEYHCSRCHQRFAGAATEGEQEAHGLHCPRCKAEAGLEPVKPTPLAMKLFAAFLGTAVVAIAAGSILSIASR